MAQIFQNTDKRTITVSVFPANKGLKSSIDAVLLTPEELTESNNIIHTTSSTRKTRPGIEPYYLSGFGSGEQIRYLCDFWRTNSGVQTQKVTAVTNGRVYSDSADGLFTKIGDVTANDITKLVTGDVLVGFMVIGIQDQAPLKYIQDGAGASFLGGSPPECWIVRKHKGRIFLTGNKASPHKVYYCSVENPEEWSGGTSGDINLDLGSSDPVGNTAIFNDLFGKLYVAKWNSLYVIDTSTTFAVAPLVDTIGCVSHNGVSTTTNDVIFPSERGLHSLATTQNYGDVESTFLSYPIHDIWSSQIDFTRSQEISACFVPEYNSYLLTYPVHGNSEFNLLGYNILTGDFFHWESFNASFLTLFSDVNKHKRLMIGTTDANIGIGRTIDSSVFLDFVNAFSTSFKTGVIFPGGKASSTFAFKNLTVHLKSRSSDIINCNYSIGGSGVRNIQISQGSPGILLGSFILGDILGGESSMQSVTKPLVGYGNSIQLAFDVTPGDDTPVEGAAFEIFGYDIECEKVGDTLETVLAG